MKRLLLTRLSPVGLFDVCLLLTLVGLLAGCGQAAPTMTPILIPSPSPTPSRTPSPTRAPAIPEAGIELISGLPDGCVNTDPTQSTVFGFQVVYHTVTTGNYGTGTLVAPDGDVLATIHSETENRDGEGQWGLYPSAFEYPANTALTMTLTTYSGNDASTPISSVSALAYNCTTGEAISQSFTRGE
jgi:hypothetical protein